MFWKISQYSQENNCVGVSGYQVFSFIIKKVSNAGAFLWILLNFYKHLFSRIIPGGCFQPEPYLDQRWLSMTLVSCSNDLWTFARPKKIFKIMSPFSFYNDIYWPRCQACMEPEKTRTSLYQHTVQINLACFQTASN